MTDIEAALDALPLVARACVVGRGRPALTAVIALDRSALAVTGTAAAEDLVAAARDPAVVNEITTGVAQVNRGLPRGARVRSFVVTGEEWLPGGDLLDEHGVLQRDAVLARYAPDIEAMYAALGDIAPAAPPDTTEASPVLAMAPGADEPSTAHDIALADETVTAVLVEEPSPEPADETFTHEAVVWESPHESPWWYRSRWLALAALALLVIGLIVLRVVITGDDGDDADRAAASTTPAAATTLAATTAPTTVASTTSPAPSTSTPSVTSAPVLLPADLLAEVDRADGLTTFRDLLARSGFEDSLAESGPLTVFAPTDEAFAALPESFLQALQRDQEALRTLLLHHMVSGDVRVADLVDGPLQMGDGSFVEVEAVEDLTLDGSARLVTTDVRAVNGILHTIDEVLVPATIDLDTLGAPTTIATTTTDPGPGGPGVEFVVPFATGTSKLGPAGSAVVADAAAALESAAAGTVVIVTGVADTLGGEEANRSLATLRADTVIRALRNAGADQVTYVSRTLLEPPDPRDPQASRRADIDIV